LSRFGNIDSPRVLVTGCPVGGDVNKVFRIIEEQDDNLIVIYIMSIEEILINNQNLSTWLTDISIDIISKITYVSVGRRYDMCNV
jgi:hypothetical protein